MTYTDPQKPLVTEIDFDGRSIVEIELAKPPESCVVFNEQAECVFPFGFTLDRHVSQKLFKLVLELGWNEITNTGVRQNWHPPGKYKVILH